MDIYWRLRLWGVPGAWRSSAPRFSPRQACAPRPIRATVPGPRSGFGTATTPGCARIAAHFGRSRRGALPFANGYERMVGDPRQNFLTAKDLFREAILASSTLGAACIAKGEKR